MTPDYFSEMLPLLADRAKQAALSWLSFKNTPLRKHLASQFDGPFGSSGSFLADPTFEAVFGWQTAGSRMLDLVPSLLTKELVECMSNPPKDLAADYTFAKEQQPYSHQIEAWRILADKDPQSLIVASGTGSGKTECFMVPILDKMVRLRNAQGGKLTGVRALFLYPLNALINSQRERLRAWTHAFGGDIKFCLYNGNTPDKPDPSRVQQLHPTEVRDRFALRAAPPPILVTNASMLEYMLVRTADAPILQQSQGKLEFVVLDEAHSYVGSQAAEMALLIRRVLLAFGVVPENIRFIATSATIGDPNGEAGQELRKFLADLSGVQLDRVHVVAGTRSIPALPNDPLIGRATLAELAAIEPSTPNSDARYFALAKDGTARRIRALFVGSGAAPVARLSDIAKLACSSDDGVLDAQTTEPLKWLDLLSGTSNAGGQPFLPVRAHIFQQTLTGIWACADIDCPNKTGTDLDQPDWPYGRTYFEPRKHCRCGSPVYEVVKCASCAEVFLEASITAEGAITHVPSLNSLDEFELDLESADEEIENQAETTETTSSADRARILIANRHFEGLEEIDIDKGSRKEANRSDATFRITATEERAGGLVCPSCGERDRPRSPMLVSSRVGAPYILGNLLPSLLEFAPDGPNPAAHPWRGRRLLTFNDSRQGTARMAARLQQESERNRVRSLVYHISLSNAADRNKLAALDEQIAKMSEALLAELPELARTTLETQLERLRTERRSFDSPVIGFSDLAGRLANQGREFASMLEHYCQFTEGAFSGPSGSVELAKMFIIREFARRPKRSNNLETMGMVGLRYSSLDKISEVPNTIRGESIFDLESWRHFLKICLDFFVRAGGSLSLPPSWRHWIGLPLHQTFLVERNAEAGPRQRRWQSAARSRSRGTLVRLLARAMNADRDTPEGVDRIDAVLDAAWEDLCQHGLLKRESVDGYLLPLDELAFAPLSEGWICPITRRILDTTLCGLTPYVPDRATDQNAVCQQVAIPVYDQPFGETTDDREAVRVGRSWLAQNEGVQALRDAGVWTIFNDRTVEMTPYFTTAEHSAQQSSKVLERYEKAFKQGDVNLLSCSTTMEMGIDIGGISMVAMNNVPPHPSNYLQRAGRAGRRGEKRAVAATLCKSNPHDQSVFNFTRWAFDSELPAPRVSLDSAVLVQRHINSFLLSGFLSEHLGSGCGEQVKLSCGSFFLGDDPIAHRFEAWCRTVGDSGPEYIRIGLAQLVRRSILAEEKATRLGDATAEMIGESVSSWRKEWDQLEAEGREIAADPDRSAKPAIQAVELRRARLENEYLLRELATRGFLPAYGFPTNIASFDNLTVGRFLKERGQGREDNRYQRRELASRDLTTALREYAPGSEVVMDGLVYRSAGVTLNWHVPADREDVKEIQDLQFAWRCRKCGTSGSTRSREATRNCDDCGAIVESRDVIEFLEPAGFAVDFYEKPGNDVSKQTFVPVEPPWINASGAWSPLPNPSLGRFRTTPRGHLFHQSRGLYGYGYALCLECGRAEPMLAAKTLPAVFQKPHRKLRRSRDEAPTCPGSNDRWKIKQNMSLGHSGWTDVLELQLRTENGSWISDQVGAATLGVALRDALAQSIGIQSNEMGCQVKQSRLDFGGSCYSILIFDRYAAGYASSAHRFIPDVFRLALDRLHCSAECDSVCPHCVLDYDQRFAIDLLDRHAALRILTTEWLDSLQLPESYAFWGDSSRLETLPLEEAIWRSIGDGGVTGVSLLPAGAYREWDIAPSRLRALAYKLAGHGINVEIRLPDRDMAALDEGSRHALASLSDHPHITIRVPDGPLRVGAGWILAETTGPRRVQWATADERALSFGVDWGTGRADPGDGGIGVLVRHESKEKYGDLSAGRILTAEEIRPVHDLGDREVEIHQELNGPLKGFGNRFWDLLLQEHSPSKQIVESTKETLISLSYSDRYMFTPLSVALILEIVTGLLKRVGTERWGADPIQIRTSGRDHDPRPGYPSKIWSDWSDTSTRDAVLVSVFKRVGLNAVVDMSPKSQLAHGRILELKFSSGSVVSLRLDQGVGYWQAEASSSYLQKAFDFGVDVENQSARLVGLTSSLKAQNIATQIFIKVR